MNENSRLRPQAIKRQCDAAVDVLDKDNEALRTVGKSLDQFVADNELESQSFGELKEHMEDYRLVLNSMTAANNEDIADYNYLKSHVGSQDIDGVVVLAQMDKAEEGFNSAERLAEKYRRMSYSTSYDPITAQSMRTQAQMYECSAALWQQIYDCWKQKEETYDQIESSTASLFTAGPLMRADIRSALETFGVSGKYQTKGNPLWRQKLQDGEISEIRRELMKMGVTKQQLQHMEEIGYLPKEVKAILESCETEEDRVFFGYLMEGTAESYQEAFLLDPNRISDFMMTMAADYSVHILEVDADGQLTADGKKAFEDFNNAILSANKVYLYDMGEAGKQMSGLLYRDVYLEKMYAFTDSLALGQAWEMSGMEPGTAEYEKEQMKLNKQIGLTNLWASEILLTENLKRAQGEAVDMKVTLTDYLTGDIGYEIKHYSNGGYVCEEVNTKILWKPNDLDNKWTGERLEELEKRKETILRGAAASMVKNGSIAALAVVNPEAALVISALCMGLEGEISTLELPEIDTGNLGFNMGLAGANEGMADLINGLTEWAEANKELDAEQWKAKMEWFGTGGACEITYSRDELQTGTIPAVLHADLYDPDVIRGIKVWEEDGIAGWMGWKDNEDYEKLIQDIEDKMKSMELSEKRRNECMKLFTGGCEVSKITDMNKWGENIGIIQDAYHSVTADKSQDGKGGSINIQDEWREYVG